MSSVKVELDLPEAIKIEAQNADLLTSDAIVKLITKELEQRKQDQDTSVEPRFKPEIAARLRQHQQEKPRGIPIAQVIEELGLDD